MGWLGQVSEACGVVGYNSPKSRTPFAAIEVARGRVSESTTNAMPADIDPVQQGKLVAALRGMGLLEPNETPLLEKLEGGVSSLIVKAQTAHQVLCVKAALPQLQVAQTWVVPVERNAAEVGWIRLASTVIPGSVPHLLGEYRPGNCFAMDYLDADAHPVWKQQLRDGVAPRASAQAVAARLVAVHAATAGQAEVAAEFANDELFYAIRLEPYFVTTATAHPDCAEALLALVRQTAETRLALVHGDVSPKNILIGPHGPIFLDAECAWYGDPAFDVAFCLNHLLLKCVWRPAHVVEYLQNFEAFMQTYVEGITWEPRSALEDRVATMLPGMLLARIDGKSPVEYITSAVEKARVRRFAKQFLQHPTGCALDIAMAWREEWRH